MKERHEICAVVISEVRGHVETIKTRYLDPYYHRIYGRYLA